MILASLIGAGGAVAADHAETSRMWLACENGHNYPIRPIAVSREYDLVTGYLVTTGDGRGVHLRLVPMGAGYRYAGVGVWFDGERGEAVLNWGTDHPTPCTVMQE
jgi:hypothetical protein